MRQNEFKKCAGCGMGVVHSGALLFYRVVVDRMIVDVGAIQRRHGLELMMGGGQQGTVLAGVMGPDGPLAKSFSKETLLVCNDCSLINKFGIAELLEVGGKESEEA